MRDKLKDRVRKHFEAGEIAEGFGNLEALKAEDFFTFLFKNNEWITEGAVSDYFWKSYLPASRYVEEVMSGEQAIHLLHHYFSKNREVSEALLEELVTEIARDVFWESRPGSAAEKTKEQAGCRFELSRMQANYF